MQHQLEINCSPVTLVIMKKKCLPINHFEYLIKEIGFTFLNNLCASTDIWEILPMQTLCSYTSISRESKSGSNSISFFLFPCESVKKHQNVPESSSKKKENNQSVQTILGTREMAKNTYQSYRGLEFSSQNSRSQYPHQVAHNRL